MWKSLKIIYGILRHDFMSYVFCYRAALKWSNQFPHIDPSDYDALQDAAWDNLSDLIAEDDLKTGGDSFREVFEVAENDKN